MTRLTVYLARTINKNPNLLFNSLCLNLLRHSHTDLKVPDFSEYRTKYSENPVQRSKDHADDKKFYTDLATYGVGLGLIYGSKSVIRDVVTYIGPSADVLALATIEVDLSDIPEGKNVTVKWRGKPLFIRHRTQAEIETERAVDLSKFRAFLQSVMI